jgi:hypothetical protein
MYKYRRTSATGIQISKNIFLISISQRTLQKRVLYVYTYMGEGFLFSPKIHIGWLLSTSPDKDIPYSV